MLNFLLVGEGLITWLTGYFISNSVMTSSILGFTLLTILISLLLTLSSLKRRPRHLNPRRYWLLGSQIIFALLYGCVALFYWLFSVFSSLSVVVETATYVAPSGNTAVVFKEVGTSTDTSFIYAYEKRGIFQKLALIQAKGTDGRAPLFLEWGQDNNDEILERFFEPNQLDVVWNDSETSLQWSLKLTSETTYCGTVDFESCSQYSE